MTDQPLTDPSTPDPAHPDDRVDRVDRVDAIDDVPEHVAGVVTHGPSAAFFDLDRTLISGSSVFVFGIAAWRAKLVPPGQFARDAAGAVGFRFAGASDDTSSKVRDRILGAVRGVHHEDLVALNASIVPKLIDRVRPEARQLLDQHRHAGRATYIVSASPVELVDPLATALGMTGGIGTVLSLIHI